MWDVKEAESFFTDENGNSFTLTMWDVKIVLISSNDVIINSFYLNYVGCKEIIQE